MCFSRAQRAGTLELAQVSLCFTSRGRQSCSATVDFLPLHGTSFRFPRVQHSGLSLRLSQQCFEIITQFSQRPYDLD